MFAGHYGPGFAIKAADKSIPLWVLFVAVQLLDFVWATLVLLGVEKVRIVPGITAANPLDLYYFPYSHSLVAALLWSGAAAVAWRLVPRLGNWKAASLVALAVFSHWVMDLLVHRPDLPLYGDTVKLGFGLWNYPVLSFALEVAILLGGMHVYLRRTKAVTAGGRYAMIVFAAAVVAVQASVSFGPPPASVKELAATSLASYAILAAVIFWLEKKRTAL